MDLLDSILRSANAQNYIDILRQHSIDISVLPTLTERDLEIIGVDSPEARAEIVEKASTLVTPREETVNFSVTSEYVEEVLTNIASQLRLHRASLIYASHQKDVVVCDVKLHRAAVVLQDCINSLSDKVNTFEDKFVKKENVKSTAGKIVTVSGIALVVAVVSGITYIKFKRLL